MFKAFNDLFDQVLRELDPRQTQASANAHTLPLATAVLLVEVMRADPAHHNSEAEAVLRALQHKFALTEDEMQTLLAHAHDTAQQSHDYHQFTRVLNEQLSHPQKIAIIEAMWTVAYADRHLDVHENAVINKVAGLLHVTHGEYIAAKLHAQATQDQGQA